jgi:hypothetical protein
MKLFARVCVQFVLVVGLSSSASQKLDPEIFIGKYNKCNKKFETVYYELNTTLQVGSLKYVYSFKHCSKNEKKQWIGSLKCYKEDGAIDQRSSGLIRNIYSDKIGVYLQLHNPELKGKLPPRAILARSSRDKWCREYCEQPSYGGPLTGQFYGSSNHSIHDLLKEASNLKLHNKALKIIGYETYLIEADTKYGNVKAWISPDLDYNCLKWEIIKEQNQFYRDGTTTNDRFTKWTAVYDAEKIKQVNDQYVITQAKFNHVIKKGDVVLGDHTYHYNLKNIDLNPDYEALGAFEIQLPEGTVATHEEVPGIEFRWTNGKFVPNIDDYLIQKLTGKPLPDFNTIKTDFDLERTSGKRTLICFWDMNQRPSRNCMMQLGKKVQELNEKDVVVIAIHSSNIDEKPLKEWVKKNNITIPVGMVRGDDEKVRLIWGVQSLPWLILTNSRHLVIDAGFGLSDLDDKIKAANE